MISVKGKKSNVVIEVDPSTVRQNEGFGKHRADTSGQIIVAADSSWAICPICSDSVNLGSVGLPNLIKRHFGSDACHDAKNKKDRERNKKKDGSLLAFMKPKPKSNPSTVSTTPVMQSLHIAMPVTPKEARPSISASNAEGTGTDSLEQHGFLHRFGRIVELLPSCMDEATSHDVLAKFPQDPLAMDIPNLHADELWEEIINPFLKGVLGWGREMDANKVLRRGKHGVDGVLQFMRYFVEVRGVSEALFEGKLSGLVEAMELRYVTRSIIITDWQIDTDLARLVSCLPEWRSRQPP